MLINKNLFSKSLILSLFLFTLLFINLTSASSTNFVFNKNLTLGNVNNDVKELQKYLNNNGFTVAKIGAGSIGKETTYFGPATKKALIKFQQANNIKPASGYFGKITRNYINKKNKFTNNNNNFTNGQPSIINNNTGYTIGGTITGLGGPVTIQNNNNQEVITINPGSNSEFTFPTKLNNNSTYTVTIKQNYLGQSCYIKDNVGIVANTNVTNIKIACGINLYFNPFTKILSNGVAQYSVSYAAGSNGTITGTTSQTIIYGQNATTVTAEPNTGYHFTTWSDGVLTAARTDTNIIDNKSLTATFAINTYTLTSSAGANGTITATDTVNYGADKTFTITPDEGYVIEDVLVDSVSVGTDATYTFTNVTEEHTITVTFVVESYYTISVSAGANGTISPSTSIVSHGSDKTFIITPSSNYGEFFVYDVLVDGVSVGTPSSYTFTNVTSNHAILALFVVGSCGDTTTQDGEECDEGDNNGGETCTFDCKLPSACGGDYVLYDWKYYPIVGIGSQCWFGENLNVGAKVNNGNSEPSCHDLSGDDSGYWSCQVNNNAIEKYCYNNSESNCTTDGGLYEWAEALQLPYDCNNAASTENGDGAYTLACPTSGSQTILATQQGICPTGWHIPSYGEWQTLAQVPDPGCDLYNWGCSTGGEKLKATSSHTPIAWDGTDIYNFSAIPPGYRNLDGTFYGRGSFAYFLSVVPYSDYPRAFWSTYLNVSDNYFYSDASERLTGVSVRCLKDSIPN